MSTTVQTGIETATLRFDSPLDIPEYFPQLQYDIIVQTEGFVGWAVALSATKPDSRGRPIEIPHTEIAQPQQITGVRVTLDAGFSAIVTATLNQNAAPPRRASDRIRVFAQLAPRHEDRNETPTEKLWVRTLIAEPELRTEVSAGAPAPASDVYPGLYFRTNLQSKGALPSIGPYELCPDIAGSDQLIPDAQSVLSTPQSWNTMYATEPYYGANNYYYVRGFNGAADPVTNNVSLYAAPSELILFPSTWKNLPLRTSKGLESVTVSANSGAIGVGNEPFVWNPTPPPGRSDFYAFVSSALPSIPEVSTWKDMGALLTENLGLGFRNALYVDGNGTSWIHVVGLTIPAHFSSAGRILLMLSSAGMTGATIGVIGDAFDSDRQPVTIVPTQVPQDSFTTGIQTTLDPGFSANLAIEFWREKARPAAGSTITLTASYVLPKEDLVDAFNRGLIDRSRDYFYYHALGIGPQPTILLGSVTFIVS